MQDIHVLLAIGSQRKRELYTSLIQGDKDLNAHIECCEPSQVLERACRKEILHALIIERDDNALPGPCTHLFDQVPNLLIMVYPLRDNCPPLCYRQVTCVEELEDSGGALLSALRCLCR